MGTTDTETTGAAARRSPTRPPGVVGYRVEERHTLTQRIAHFLDWYADKEPGKVATYALVVKAVNNYAQMPRQEGQEAMQVRGRMSTVRAVLLRDYERGLVTVPGIGVRATCSSDDVVENVLSKDSRRLVSARNRVEQTLNVVDEKKLRSERLRTFAREAAGAAKALGGDRIARLLLPPPVK